jgi:hypothetical protein
MLGISCILLAMFNIATIANIFTSKQLFADVYETLFVSVVTIVMACKASHTLEKHQVKIFWNEIFGLKIFSQKQDFLLKKLVNKERKKIRTEKENSQKLIVGMFPKKIATVLSGVKENTTTEDLCETFLNATVLMADIKVSNIDRIEERVMVEVLSNLCSIFERRAGGKFHGDFAEIFTDQLSIDLLKKNAMKHFTFVSGIRAGNATLRYLN